MTNSSFGIRTRGLIAALAALAACSPSALVDVEPSGNLVDPLTVQTANGANQLYNFALTAFFARYGGTGRFSQGLNNYIVASGLLSDELLRGRNFFLRGFDERTEGSTQFGTNAGQFYNNLHMPRVLTQQAREALRRFAPGTEVRQAEMFALEAYTIIWFAELFCSGIPLTSVPLDKAPAPTAGFSTEELFERAVVMLDSAIAMASTDARIANLARVAQGRALLGLGRFAEAATAVNAVATDFIYWAEFDPTANPNVSVLAKANELGFMIGQGNVQVVDNEGTNGLVWSTDPRTGVMTAPTRFGAMQLAAKYSKNAAGVLQTATTITDNPIRVADGLEARLIEAEAALSAGDPSWLTTLNMLRATCIGAAACAPVPGITAPSLPPLADPGTPAARVDLLMSERAMWLYLTGHRQGDLRRLATHYNRDRQTLWPTGTYSNPGFPPFTAGASTHGTQYGTDVVFKPYFTEQRENPLYTGCNHLDP